MAAASTFLLQLGPSRVEASRVPDGAVDLPVQVLGLEAFDLQDALLRPVLVFTAQQSVNTNTNTSMS